MNTAIDVECIWHTQVCQSRISSILLASDGRALIVGCAAAAPKLNFDQQDHPLAVVNAQDGSIQKYIETEVPIDVLALAQSNSQSQFHCLAGGGQLLEINTKANDPIISWSTLAGTPADTQTTTKQQAPSTPDATVQQQSHATTAEFIAESGYRGPKQGYLYRKGQRGAGYYRKDVVRELAPSSGKEELEDEKNHAPSVKNRDSTKVQRYLQACKETPSSLKSCLFLSSRGLIVTGSWASEDGAVYLWQNRNNLMKSEDSPCINDSPTYQRLPALLGHTSCVLALTTNPEENMLFTGSYDHTIKVWDVDQKRCLHTLRGHGGGIRALAVSSDGKQLFSAAADNTIRVWSTEHWVCLRTLSGRHEDTTWPCCIAVSKSPPCLLVSGSTGPFGNSNIKVFSTSTGTCLATFAQLRPDDRGDISALCFSEDGSTVYTGASDGTVAAWKLLSKETSITSAKTGGGGFRKGFM